MRFSVWPSPERPWADVLDIVQACDRAGWYGVYFADHFMPNDLGGEALDGPVNECWAVMAGLAAATEHLRVGSLVCGNLYRHPAVVANQAATIDQISNGRFVLGVGAGWQINEHKAYGIDLLSTKQRLDRFDEACAVITSLLREKRTTFDGEWYEITDAPCDPKPVQSPLPLLVGGNGVNLMFRLSCS
jgi:alkanesulfonate monooxygenase SsuD/methylene tetrahydromethanopterin reductase-like flavin-dependent oxidoreductase (luciferase family)